MRNKLILFLMLALFGSTSFLRADELTVHDGTATNSYVPVYGFYADAYLKCEMVYPATELSAMNGATINGVKFYASSPAPDAWTSTWQVFVSEVANASISDFYGPGTVVYEGTLNGTGAEMTIDFSTPYQYNGGNLLIGVYNIALGNYKSVTWAGEDVTGASVQGYSYSALSSINPTQRNFLPKTTFVYEAGTPVPPVPPTPAGEITMVPEEFTLGYRPTNGWMEPFNVKIYGEQTTIEASISNTSEVEPFSLSEDINGITIPAEGFGFEVIANNVPEGDYTEEFTVFFAANRDIKTAPVTAYIYEASAPDIVEMPRQITFSSNAYEDQLDSDIYPNYRLTADMEMANDAVYYFSGYYDYKYNIVAKNAAGEVIDDAIIAIYNKVPGEVLHFSPEVEPVLMVTNGQVTDQPLLAGDYYVVVASNDFNMIEVTRETIPAPTEITYVAPSPENYAEDVAAPLTLAWEGGDNATQYQVCFGTQYPPQPVMDWTVIDENYGSYTVNSLLSNTQYFWQIKVKNSNGTQEGEVRGFTTSFTAPNSVTASEVEIFTDGSTLVKWKHNSGTMGDLDEIQIGSGTNSNSYFPTYNLYNYSLTEQIYTADEIGGTAGYINSISFYPVGAITRNLQVYIANTDKESFSGSTDWVAMSEENLVYAGNVSMVANTWTTINFTEPFEYEGGNIILAVNDLTGTWTSSISYYVFDATNQSINIYQDSAPYSAIAPSGNGTVRAFKNQIVINKESRAIAQDRTFVGYDVYADTIKLNSELLTEKQFLVENLDYNMDGYDINVKAVYDEGASNHSTPVVTVKVSGYSNFTGTVTELISGEPVEGVTVTFTGKDEFNNNVEFSGTTNANGKYTVNAKVGTYKGTASLEGCEPSVQTGLALAYGENTVVDFVIHESYNPVGAVIADELITDDGSMARVRWSLGSIAGGSATTFTEGFEAGIPADWTVIDANNDTYTWINTGSVTTTWPYYAGMTIEWYRTGADAIVSGSYINGVGALTPDDYIVTPQVNLAAGSTFSFWAAATDANYAADHFGVFVSDDMSNWTMVNEWTMTAKGDRIAGGRESRDGNGAKLGNWYNFSVDLSAFAGQKYIAIRHFNCTDQYILCVDDVELSAGRANRDVDYYTVVRKALVKETEITEADSLMLIDNYTDTIYGDFDWNNLEPGLYQYGVRAVYPQPDRNGRDELTVYEGTVTNNTVPMYVFYFDDYTRSQYVIPAEDLASMEGGEISAIKFYTSSSNIPYTTVSSFNIYMTEVPSTTISSFVPQSDAQVVFSGTADFVTEGTGGSVTINFSTPYQYNGGNLLIGCDNTTDAGYKNIYFYGQTVDGASVAGYNSSSSAAATATQRNFIPMTTFFFEAGQGGPGSNDNPVTDFTWSNILPKDIEANVNINVHTAMGSVEGTEVSLTNLYENLAYEFTADETGINNFETFHKGVYNLKANLGGYEASVNGQVIGEDGLEVSIWSDTTITIELQEIFKPVDMLTISGTGFARWTDMLPHDDRIAQRYHVMCNGIFQGETTDNYMQLDVTNLTVGETYEGAVAVVYSTGMSEFVTANFTLIDCSTVNPIEDLEAAPNCEEVILTWNGGTPTPPTPPTPPTGDVVVKLTVGDVWGDGSGYQMLLDNTHSLYGTTIPTTGALSLACSGNEAIYDQFSHKIPTNADGSCSTSNIVINNSIEITIPAGTYDWCITNPTPGDRIWIASSQGNVGGRYDDYVFEGGHTYEFTVTLQGSNDATNVTITGGKGLNQPNMGIMSNDVRTANDVASADLVNAGTGFGAAANDNRDGNWYYYDNGVNEDAIGTGGGNFWWGVMFPAGSYEGTTLTKVTAYDYMAMTGNVTIYQGGTSAPGTALGNTNVTFTGVNDFVEFTFAEPITLDPTQNVWVIFYNGSGATYPAAVCTNTGDPNGRWVSTDGTSWMDLVTAGLSYTFMIRAYIEQGGGSAATNIVPGKYNIFMDGTVIGTTSDNYFVVTPEDHEQHEYEVRYVDANYNFSCPVSVVAAAGTVAGVTDLDFTAGNDPEITVTWNGVAESYLVYYGIVDMSTGQVYMDVVGETTEHEFTFDLDQTAGYHLIVVQAVTGECASDLQTDINNGNYILVEYDNVIEKNVINAIYPNPTTGNITIEAEGMNHVTVANVLGQVVYDADVEGDMMQLNMGQFNAGLYLVRVHSVNGVSVERITVVK